jgi:hypothetical protein
LRFLKRKQKVIQTQQQQISMWIDLIIDFQKHSKKNLIYVEKDANAPPFTNPKIDRTFE